MNESLDQKSGCLGFLQKLLAGASADNGDRQGPWPFAKKQYLLSKAEFSFYRVLQQACGDQYVVCPKVGLGDLLYVKKDTEKRQSYRNKIDRKHIDFVLCHPETMMVEAAIELDDRSHDEQKAKQRDTDKDKACQDAGLPILRFKAQRSYDPAKVRAELSKLSE